MKDNVLGSYETLVHTFLKKYSYTLKFSGVKGHDVCNLLSNSSAKNA